MRPVRLEMQGFSAFRDRAEIDFTDADLFALVGPTGAGKSSVIDAMVFALYGAVPRYDSENLVHPVITQGAVEARVRLDFTVAGATYTATRIVRRTRTGATTKEARLERCADGTGGTGGASGTVLADDAKGLTAAVCDLVGLDLEQFTKCVVLPQGAFATLLHDTKAKRQDLLVKLLDLGVYERVAAGARAEAKQATTRIEFLDEQLARSAHATKDAVRELTGHLDAVDAVVAALDEAAPTLARLDDGLREAEDEMRRQRASIQLVADIAVPAGVADVAEQARAAVEAADAAERAEAATAGSVADAEATMAGLADAAELQTLRRDREALAELSVKVDTGASMVAELEAASPVRRDALERARASATAAADALDRARVANAAADIARHLHAGDDCPVCGHRIDTLATVESGALADAEARQRQAASATEAATAEWTAHDTKLNEYRTLFEQRIAERDTLAARLADGPGAEEIERSLARIADGERRLAEARRADADARAGTRAARAGAEAARARVVSARADFTAVRDRLIALGPPPPGDDLTADWQGLLDWAAGRREQLGADLADATATRDGAAKQRTEAVDILCDQARRAGVTVDDPARLRDACVTEAATTRAQLVQLTAERERVAQLRTERADLDERRQVHELLASQLGARGFEAWLLDEALDALLVGASTWLEQLSSGRYAMTVDDKNQFAVIDHANADERRLARTLSGGETFLASLALALALAERVTELSATGAASLDAIFLDEGFGTLDPATLDVVATAIEELGATGRMVGVVSHVRELAERVPVRFEIAKDPGTSTVRRVEA